MGKLFSQTSAFYFKVSTNFKGKYKVPIKRRENKYHRTVYSVVGPPLMLQLIENPFFLQLQNCNAQFVPKKRVCHFKNNYFSTRFVRYACKSQKKEIANFCAQIEMSLLGAIRVIVTLVTVILVLQFSCTSKYVLNIRCPCQYAQGISPSNCTIGNHKNSPLF